MSGSREGKWDRAARFLRIFNILRAYPDGISAPKIAERIGVSRRTIYRDLEAMEMDGGLPLWNDNGKWGIDRKVELPELALTADEALHLFLGVRLLARAADERDTAMIGTFAKLANALPPVLASHLRATIDTVADTPENARFTRVLRGLAKAFTDQRIVEITYRSGTYGTTIQEKKRRVRPLAIEPSATTHGLYLIAWDEERGEQRTFKVERIVDVSVTPQTFEAPDDAPAAKVLRHAWDVITDQPMTKIVLRFAPNVAERVNETRWHPSQDTTMAPDGSLVWTARVSGTAEIMSWIVGWGGDVTVEEPSSLRREVIARHRQALARYEAPPARAAARSRANQ